MSTEIKRRELGDRLQAAFAADLQAQLAVTQLRPRRERFAMRRVRWLLATGVALIVAPSVAYAAGVFTSAQSVAKSLPASDVMLGLGQQPTCTVVQAGVRYSCTLSTALPADPTTQLTPVQSDELAEAKTPGIEKYLAEGAAISRPDWMREQALIAASRHKLLESFGFTHAQLQAYDAALVAGTDGIGTGQFTGVVVPIVGADDRIDGGCRSTDGNGTQWDCYLGQAAVNQQIVTAVGTTVPSGGVGYGPSVQKGPYVTNPCSSSSTATVCMEG